jgi:hypothetical protein
VQRLLAKELPITVRLMGIRLSAFRSSATSPSQQKLTALLPQSAAHCGTKLLGSACTSMPEKPGTKPASQSDVGHCRIAAEQVGILPASVVGGWSCSKAIGKDGPLEGPHVKSVHSDRKLAHAVAHGHMSSHLCLTDGDTPAVQSASDFAVSSDAQHALAAIGLGACGRLQSCEGSVQMVEGGQTDVLLRQSVMASAQSVDVAVSGAICNSAAPDAQPKPLASTTCLGGQHSSTLGSALPILTPDAISNHGEACSVRRATAAAVAMGRGFGVHFAFCPEDLHMPGACEASTATPWKLTVPQGSVIGENTDGAHALEDDELARLNRPQPSNGQPPDLACIPCTKTEGGHFVRKVESAMDTSAANYPHVLCPVQSVLEAGLRGHVAQSSLSIEHSMAQDHACKHEGTDAGVQITALKAEGINTLRGQFTGDACKRQECTGDLTGRGVYSSPVSAGSGQNHALKASSAKDDECIFEKSGFGLQCNAHFETCGVRAAVEGGGDAGESVWVQESSSSYAVVDSKCSVGEVCAVCGENVPEPEWQQHADWHLAQQLSATVNGPGYISTARQQASTCNVGARKSSGVGKHPRSEQQDVSTLPQGAKRLSNTSLVTRSRSSNLRGSQVAGVANGQLKIYFRKKGSVCD